MTYAIVYSSTTGNTRMLAEAIREALPAEECLYYGAPASEALAADILYVGFWTDKGDCNYDISVFLSQLTSQRLFLFGTAGFGGSPDYFQRILTAARAHLAPGVRLIGSYMCQGKMPSVIRQRYEAMEQGPYRTTLLENYDTALSHPDQTDLDGLRSAILAEK